MLSASRFPRDKELKKKWLAAINKKFCGSLRICSRHFKEEDFRHSIGNKRYLKKGVIPSLHLNERSKNNEFSDSQDATAKENQLIETVNKCTMDAAETKSLSITKIEIKSGSNDQMSHIDGKDVEVSVGEECTNTRFITQGCYSESTVPET